jgi:hypothetical protein
MPTGPECFICQKLSGLISLIRGIRLLLNCTGNCFYMERLEYRIEEIRFVKGIIERDVRSEYSGILERLKSFEGVKLAKLSH